MNRRLFKRLFFGFLLLLGLGVALFPRQILLQCVAWQASSYCKEAFGARLTFETLQWEKGAILFKKGELHKEGEVEAVFNQASFTPSFNLKQRLFGGELILDGLKIVHRKTELRPVPSPPSPTYKLFTFFLDTIVEGGELYLYDYLSKNHLFQHSCFDLHHHVFGKETCGTISFELDPDMPKLVAGFKERAGGCVEVSAHFESHYLPDLSHLLTYFFQNYLPEPSFNWDVLKGTIDGDLEVELVKGAPIQVKGSIFLNGVQGENPSLKLFTEIDHLSCNFDIDFSHVSTINGEFNLEGGRLALQEYGPFWEGIWDLKNIHTQLCVKEGKVESSTLKGRLMGMEGELILDWQADDLLMEIGFRGASKEMQTLLPDSFQKRFIKAFPDDFFQLQAGLKRSKEGLNLEGELAIADQNAAVHRLSFGCLLAKEEQRIGLKELVPYYPNFSLSRSVDSFLQNLKQQFCLSQKRFGWFEGKGFPLEKFLTPFLLYDVNMEATGLADFKGTFDERYLVMFYEGRDFNLESHHFQFHAGSIKEHPEFGISAVHYVDLKTWNHVGFLPLKEADYWQKNYDFHLEKTQAVVNFENNAIHIQNIQTTSEGVDFEGNVNITIRSIEDVDLKIYVDKLKGNAPDARRFLAHFKPSFFWQLPIEGDVSAENEALFFHYHFSPTASLKEGWMEGNVCLKTIYPYFSLNDLQAHVAYDALQNTITVSKGEGVLQVANRELPLHISTPSFTLKEFPDFLVDFTADITEEGTPFLTLKGSTQRVAEGRKFSLIGEGIYPFDMLYLQCLHSADQRDSLDFVCGPWRGEAQLSWDQHSIQIEKCTCFSTQKSGICFSGLYDIATQCLKGEISELIYDLTQLTAPFEKLSLWKPKGEVAGTGTFNWNVKGEIEAYATLAFRDLGFAGIHFGDGKDLRCVFSSTTGLSVEGLEVEIPFGTGIEKYKLGRFHYAIHEEKALFEGFDFSLPPEKLPRIAQIAESLFPGKIHPIAVECLETLKHQEPLEGRVSLEIAPQTMGICLNLKDGVYYLSDQRLDLKNFHLMYDPQELNLWGQCLYQENYYWLHLVTDSSTMKQGKLSLSERELSHETKDQLVVLTALWEREEKKGWSIKEVEGIFSGMDVSLKAAQDPETLSDAIALTGRVGFDPAKMASFLNTEWKGLIEKFQISGGFALEGDFSLNKQNFSDMAFSGSVLGNACKVAGLSFEAFSSALDYSPNRVALSELSIKDWAGRLSADTMVFTRDEKKDWSLSLDHLSLTDLRLSRLKSPWTQRSRGDKPLFRSLFIPVFYLENFSGTLADVKTFKGSGAAKFTNLPKKTIFSNLLFLPIEITARIGLDLTSLVPVRGTIIYTIHDGKIFLDEFKEMYSDGKRSRFYLVKGAPAFLDFKGNLSMKVKMKQYSLLMKLAEFFTVSVKGTLLHPSYTFSNHIDDDEDP